MDPGPGDSRAGGGGLVWSCGCELVLERGHGFPAVAIVQAASSPGARKARDFERWSIAAT